VNRLFGRIYPATILAKRHYPNLKHPITKEEITDTILDYGDSVVVAESKSTLFSLAALVAGEKSAIEQKFNDIVYDSAKQLHNAITVIKTGDLKTIGLDPTRIKRYYPTVITLQFFPLDPLIYKKMKRTFEERDLLQGIGIAPLQFIYIEDLELLETALATGKNLSDLLRQKTENDRTRIITFRNFLIEQVPECFRQQNAYILRQFEQTTNTTREFFQARERK